MTRTIVAMLFASVIAGLAYPRLELAFKCRVPDSEPCVWAKAYWPLSRLVEPPIVAVVMFTALALIAVAVRATRR